MAQRDIIRNITQGHKVDLSGARMDETDAVVAFMLGGAFRQSLDETFAGIAVTSGRGNIVENIEKYELAEKLGFELVDGAALLGEFKEIFTSSGHVVTDSLIQLKEAILAQRKLVIFDQESYALLRNMSPETLKTFLGLETLDDLDDEVYNQLNEIRILLELFELSNQVLHTTNIPEDADAVSIRSGAAPKKMSSAVTLLAEYEFNKATQQFEGVQGSPYTYSRTYTAETSDNDLAIINDAMSEMVDLGQIDFKTLQGLKKILIVDGNDRHIMYSRETGTLVIDRMALKNRNLLMLELFHDLLHVRVKTNGIIAPPRLQNYRAGLDELSAIMAEYAASRGARRHR